jgi:hypothetical protein
MIIPSTITSQIATAPGPASAAKNILNPRLISVAMAPTKFIPIAQPIIASKNLHIHPEIENINCPIEVKNKPTGLGIFPVASCIPVALAQRQAGNRASGLDV